MTEFVPLGLLLTEFVPVGNTLDLMDSENSVKQLLLCGKTSVLTKVYVKRAKTFLVKDRQCNLLTSHAGAGVLWRNLVGYPIP